MSSTFYAYVGNGSNQVSVLRMSSETGELAKLQEATRSGKAGALGHLQAMKKAAVAV